MLHIEFPLHTKRFRTKNTAGTTKNPALKLCCCIKHFISGNYLATNCLFIILLAVKSNLQSIICLFCILTFRNRSHFTDFKSSLISECRLFTLTFRVEPYVKCIFNYNFEVVLYQQRLKIRCKVALYRLDNLIQTKVMLFWQVKISRKPINPPYCQHIIKS